MRAAFLTACVLVFASAVPEVLAQPASQAGFIEGKGYFFPEEAPNDPERFVGDVLAREEVVLRPVGWLHLVAGIDFRANSHGQVEDEWRLDVEDRGLLRPRLGLRTAALNFSAGRFRLDVGKQFVRWGRADVIYPTDRFAPRDYMNVVDTQLLPLIGARASVQFGSETLEAVWSPQLTPSRLPLVDQRWSPVPPGIPVADLGGDIPEGSQFGGRWRHTGSRLETAVSYFDGYNHQPDIELLTSPDALDLAFRRVYPSIRQGGADLALPTPWFTLKLEAAYVWSPSKSSDEYVLYVVEIERQWGNWVVDVGYAGEEVIEERVPFTFSVDRGLAKSVIGRVAWAADATRTLTFEGAVRQEGEGYYGKAEFSQSLGQHWRMTVAAVGLGGDPGDFLGQYRRNSHASASLRLSF